MGVAGRRGHQHDRAVVDGLGDRGRVGAKGVGDRHAPDLETEVMSGLVDARMAAARHDDARSGKLRSLGQGAVSGSLDREELAFRAARGERSEEHTSELQSLMRLSYAVFCLNKK